MDAAPLHSCSGLLGLRFFHALLGFWCTFVGSGSALTVIQTPSFVNVSTTDPTGISFSCSVDETTYYIYLYRQLPGKTELKVLGYLPTSTTRFEDIPDELKDQLKGQGSTSTNPPFVDSGSALTVIQTPSFVNVSTTDPTGISFSCSVDDTNYRIFLYRQLPGKTELKVLGYLPTGSSTTLDDIPDELKDRLKGQGSTSTNPRKRELRIELLNPQASDTGFYLCAGLLQQQPQAEMAAAPLHSCSGLPGPLFFHALLAFWCTFVGSGSALTVIQTPSFVNVSTTDPTGISFSCSVDETTYYIYLYRQLPGKTELKVLGYLPPGTTTLDDIPDELKDQLKGQGSTSTNPPFVGSGSALTVIQTPSFVNGSTGKNIIFHCSVDGTDYNFFWYRQLPGKVELEVLGSLYTHSKNIEESPEKLRDRLKVERSKSTNPPKWEMSLELLNLQESDTGFYLCAVVYTVKKKEIVPGAKLNIRNKSALYSFLFISSFYLTSITFVGSGSAQNVIQTPSFVNSLAGANVNFYCSVDKGYNFYWYRQLPGKTDLEVLGSLYSHSTTLEDIPNDLKDRLNGRISDNSDTSRRKMYLNLSNLQANDKGFYLCAGVYTVKERGTVAGAKLSIRMKSALYSFQFISMFYLTSY
ncbi:hypothetical protein Chor_016198 [Crotalus horridus]